MQLQDYRENHAGTTTIRIAVEIDDAEYRLKYQDRDGPTAGVRLERKDETIYAGSIRRNFTPDEDGLREVVWQVFEDSLDPEIYEVLREEPDEVNGMPGDEIIYVPDNEPGIADR
ncbi:MAG: hypothetical protein ABEK16_03155 [Candidatus Nanohalobium sp.]